MSWFGVWSRSAARTRELLDQLCTETPEPLAPRLLWRDDDRLVIALCADVHREQQSSADVETTFVAGELRLDDPAELCEELHCSQDSSSAELCARLWQRDEARAAPQLRGDFALSSFDRASGTLWLVRDPIGVKPLYYVALDSGLVWSSSFARLTQLRELPRELDARMVVDYLGELPEDPSRTLLRAVRRLPPASRLIAQLARVQEVASYFSFTPQTPRLSSDAAYAEALRDKLDAAVRARLSPTGRTATLLSGGLDSSFIAALASRTLARDHRGPLLTLSARFEQLPQCDEQSFQTAMVRQIGSEHVEFRPSPRDSSGELTALFATFGQPRPIGAHWLAWSALTLAAQHEVDVVLTGIDGDRVVSHGEAHLTELSRSRRYARLLQECWGYDHRSALGRTQLFAQQAALGALPMTWLHRMDDRRSWSSPEAAVLRRFIHPHQLTATDARQRLLVQSRRPATPLEAHQRRIEAADRSADLELLAALEPRFGVRLAHPFYDRRVIEFCLGLPSEQRKRGKRGRFVLREAMRGLVPDQVRLRQDKAYFDAAFREWAHGWLTARDPSSLLPAHTPLEDFLPVGQLRREITTILAQRNGGPELDFLWRAVILSRWFEGLARGKGEAFAT